MTGKKGKARVRKYWTKDHKYWVDNNGGVHCGKCDKHVDVTTIGGGVYLIEHHAVCAKDGGR